MTEHSADTVERVAKAIYNTLEGPVANQDYARQMRQHELSLELARAALSALTLEDAKLREAADALAEAVRLQVEEGVQDHAKIFRDDGVHSKHDLCRHGLPQYNGCEACSDDHLSNALTAYRAIADTPKECE